MHPRLGNSRSAGGLTVVEVVVAVLVLSVGLLGLTASAAVTTRLIGEGKRETEVAALAAERLEMARSRHCSGPNGGSATSGRFTVTWTGRSVAGGRAYAMRVVVASRTARGIRADTFATTILC